MGLRQKLNGQPVVIAAAALIAIAVAGYFIAHTAFGGKRAQAATKAFFSADDGKSWFVDDVKLVPPFKTTDGRDAVAAVVISCKGGKDPFVLYLWRYTPEGKKELEENRSGPDTAMKREVKKPGRPDWIKQTDFLKSSQVTAIECPPGQDDMVTVDP